MVNRAANNNGGACIKSSRADRQARLCQVFWLCLLLACLVAPIARAQDGRALLRVDAADGFAFAGSRQDQGNVEHVGVDHPSFKRAIRMVTRSDPGAEWGVQATLRTDFDIKDGDVVLAKFWLRCVESMTGEGFAGFVFEELAAPNEKAADLRVAAGREWVQCFVPFRARRDFRAGESQICFRGGYDRQTVEIGGIELVNYGPKVDLASLPRTSLAYAGRDAEAPWRKAALERIEQMRKAPLTVQIVDTTGRPVRDARVHVKMSRLAFGIGSCVTVDQIVGTSPDDARCREIIEKHFNRVVFENDMKWPAMWDGPPAKLDAAVDWLRKRKIDIRGHNLIWPGWEWLPRQLRVHRNDPAKLRELSERRVVSTVAHFRGKVMEWDVVNEPYNNVDLQNLLGRDVMVDWFRLAKQADPDGRMYINDFGIFDGGPGNDHRRHYFETIRMLRQKGAPLDGIGIQSHFAASMPPPTQLLSVLDQFATFGLPIQSTELSLDSDDRELQADYLRDYMIAMFSHPQVDGVMLWGFWEGRHWRPNAALWTKDWQPRPIANAWLDLVTRQWVTDETLVTDGSGLASVRGFVGSYDVEVRADGKSIRQSILLPKAGGRVTIVIE